MSILDSECGDECISFSMVFFFLRNLMKNVFFFWDLLFIKEQGSETSFYSTKLTRKLTAYFFFWRTLVSLNKTVIRKHNNNIPSEGAVRMFFTLVSWPRTVGSLVIPNYDALAAIVCCSTHVNHNVFVNNWK